MDETQTPDVTTAGTTGVPVTVLLTNIVGIKWHAFLLRDLQWCGIDPRGSLAVPRAQALP